MPDILIGDGVAKTADVIVGGGNCRFVASGGHHRSVPGLDSVELYRFAGLGVGMMRFFDATIRDRGIEVLYAARATKLLTSPKRRDSWG